MDKATAKRKSYTIKNKLDILQEYQPVVKGKGFIAVSKKYNIPPSTLKGWFKDKQKLQETLQSREVNSRTRRRAFRGGRNPEYPEIETKLIKWIEERNTKGLRVKDKYIELKAKQFFEDRNNQADVDRNEIDTFKASKGWIERFKKEIN